ncbi:hypothetical protein CMO89_01365 [Candidatus Woesearchaeota archaeon]|nr:hypothetical protein [Candidatus Woesearchaeota archaeon]
MKKKTNKGKAVKRTKAVIKARKPSKVQKRAVKAQKKPAKLQKKQVRTQKSVQIDDTPLGEMDSKEKEEFLYDEVTGSRNKKPVMSVLNKAKLGKHEMDELFCDWS